MKNQSNLNYQFGPWKQNTISYNVHQNSNNNKNKNNNNQLQSQQKQSLSKHKKSNSFINNINNNNNGNAIMLPKVPKKSLRYQYHEHLPVNIQHLQIHQQQNNKKNKKSNNKYQQSINRKKDSRTISFDQSFCFYHRILPKTNRKDKFQIKFSIVDPEQQSQILSKIQVSRQIPKSVTLDKNNSEKPTINHSQSKQFSRKRSLIQLLKYMKCQNYQASIFKERPKGRNIFQDHRLMNYDSNAQNKYYYPAYASVNSNTLKYQKSKSKI